MQEIFMHSLIHGLEDCVKLLPLLFLSYLVVEYAEHKMSSKTKELIYRAGKAGPFLGSLIGLIPQCGFAAAAAGLFAGSMISPGTLVAVFLATSDEMLPIMVSEGIAAGTIGKILLVKAVTAAAAGLVTDFAIEKIWGPRKRIPEHLEMCEHENCGCSEHGILHSSLYHTLHTALFLFLISFVLGLGMEWLEETGAVGQQITIPGLEAMACGLVGLIPNCAASVLITQLYLEGVISSGGLFAGLLCGAGTGLLVLWREDRGLKMKEAVTLVLYLSGTVGGMAAGLLGIL